MTAAPHGEKAERHRGEIAAQQVEPRDQPERPAEKILRPREQAPLRDLDAGERIEPGMHQSRQHRAADHHLESEEAARPELAPQLMRGAHMHQPGLHIALEPARALAEPAHQACAAPPQRWWRKAWRSDSPSREPDAEIGILGDVERVPRHEPFQRRHAEMVRGAAERDRQASCRARATARRTARNIRA